jgi:hypothetical protein
MHRGVVLGRGDEVWLGFWRCDRLLRRCGLLPPRLHVDQGAQRTLHLPHHGGGLGAAAQRGRKVVAVLRSKAEAVHGLSIGSDDLGGEPCPERIGGTQRGNRCHGCFVADGAGLGRVGRGRREARAQRGELVAGDGGGEIGQRMHGNDGPLE